MSREKQWCKKSVVYQVYPKSFNDSNGDGNGDLNGITEKLPYIKELGADVIWLNPIFVSPQVDNGYDIADYKDIDPSLGTMADFERLLARAHELGLKILLDLVVNHTSDQHEWFKEAKKSRDNKYHDYYIWKDRNGDKLPNNWGSSFGGPAWEYVEEVDQYYLHCFAKEQPDLNWENPMDRKDAFDILSYSEKKDMFPFLFIDGRGYAEKGRLPVYERVNWPQHLKETTKHNMHLVDDLTEYVRKESHDVQKGAILFPSSEDGTLIGWDEIREYLNAMSGVHAVDGGCDNLEFNRSDATKAAGLQTLAVMLGIPMNETLAIGDSENDLDILRAAGIGIAMGNAPTDIKRYADEVTLSNDEDGVAVVLERIASLI